MRTGSHEVHLFVSQNGFKVSLVCHNEKCEILTLRLTCYSAILFMWYKLYHMYNIAIYFLIRKHLFKFRFVYINQNSKHIMVPKILFFGLVIIFHLHGTLPYVYYNVNSKSV